MCEHNGALKIALTSAPVDGQANDALIAFLSKKLKIPKGCIEIISGHANKMKKLRVVTSVNLEELFKQI